MKEEVLEKFKEYVVSNKIRFISQGEDILVEYDLDNDQLNDLLNQDKSGDANDTIRKFEKLCTDIVAAAAEYSKTQGESKED